MDRNSASNLLAWYENPVNWFLIVGAVGAVVFFWWAGGMPGIAQEDGTYACEHDYYANGLGNVAGMNPSVSVVDGEIDRVSLNEYSDAPGKYSDYKRTAPNALEITVDGIDYRCEA